MFHRKAAPFLATTFCSAGTTKLLSRHQRRRKLSLSAIFSGNVGRSEWLIALLTTFILTVLIVATKLYLYASHSVPHRNYMKFIYPLVPPNQQRQRNLMHYEDTRNGGDDSALPFNKLYRIPNSMRNVGDRSDRYVQLRKETDATLPVQQYERSLQFVHQLESHDPYLNMKPAFQEDKEEDASDSKEESDTTNQGIHESKVIFPPQQQHNSDQVTNAAYDIYNCPDAPPEGYPYTWNLLEILKNWKPDNTTRPSSNLIHQSLSVFDYTTDYAKAMAYRTAELPFIVIHDPAVAETVERWNTPGYLRRLMGDALRRTEYSENNHFMHYLPPYKSKRLRTTRMNEAPRTFVRLSYMDWLRHANVTDDTLLGPDHPHWYYRLIGCGMKGNDGSCDAESSEYLFDEMTFFQPRPGQLYLLEPEDQNDIQCRFGMKGVIAENHRYILSHPNQCEHLPLYPIGHPRARYSAIDWSNPNLQAFPQFALAQGNEVVLTAGQVLYLPTEWFHFIVSLELNFQCNTQSSITKQYKQYIKQCGF